MKINQAVRKIFKTLKPNQKEVLIKRFGLFGNSKNTLAKIGSELDLTRERIRQIENSAINELVKDETQAKIKPTQLALERAVKKLGEIVVEPTISSEVLAKKDRTQEIINGLMLLITVLPGMNRTKKNQKFKKYWYLSKFNKSEIDRSALELEKILKKNKEVMAWRELQITFNKTTLGKKVNYTGNTLRQIFEVNKSLGIDQDGNFGLMKWPQVNPMSARDKAFLVLKKYDQPMHYQEIAEKIAKEDFYSKHNPTAPTVHNEVILDERFVLIGRGIYALTEWGYLPGTVQEVIRAILKQNPKGLTRDQIVKQVKDQRQVARNTVLANLNRKNKFKRVGKDKFQLAR